MRVIEITTSEAEYAIPFMKGYTVFNVEQHNGLPDHYFAKPDTIMPACSLKLGRLSSPDIAAVWGQPLDNGSSGELKSA